MLKSDRLVCEKNATKAQPVTNCNLGSINYVYFNYKVNLLIGREKIFAALNWLYSTRFYDLVSVWALSSMKLPVKRKVHTIQYWLKCPIWWNWWCPQRNFAKLFSSKNRMIDRSRGEWKTVKFTNFWSLSLLVDTSRWIWMLQKSKFQFWSSMV